MDILLDTHIFLWWDAASPSLSRAAKSLIGAPEHSIFVSAASIWEIAIKRRLSKLTFSGSPIHGIRANGFVELATPGLDAEVAGDLDWGHNDPFDRMILAQALRRNLTLITADIVMQGFIGVAMVAGA